MSVHYIEQMFNNLDDLFNNLNVPLTVSAAKIIILYTSNPLKEYHVRDIAEQSKTSVGTASEVLNKLENANFLTCRELGQMKLYKLNTQLGLITQYKIFLNTALITNLLKPVFKYSYRIFLYGSWGKGTNSDTSDIDILIETNQKEKASEIIQKIKNPLLSPQIVNAIEYVNMKRENPTFTKKINEGIIIWNAE